MSSKSIEGDNDISVVINVWGKDSPHALGRSLRSIEGQTLKPSEVLIVIDGPINAQLEGEIAKFEVESSFEVRVFRVSVATGLWNGRNVGIAEARNEIIALHDADDVMHPERLRLQLEALENHEIDILGCPVMEFDSSSEKLLGIRSFGSSNTINKKMQWQNVINHSSVMMHKPAVISIGGYRDVYLAEDYELWLRLISAGKKIANCEFVLQAFGVDANLMKRRGGYRFLSSELKIHSLIKSMNQMNVLVSWLRLLLRISFRLGPGVARLIYHKKFQLHKNNKSRRSLDDFTDSSPIVCL
jgi:glycosyltransferase involved in cell wall biosynthesis